MKALLLIPLYCLAFWIVWQAWHLHKEPTDG